MVKGDWLVTLSDSALRSLGTFSKVATLWGDAPFPVQVLGGLGQEGSLVIHVGANAAAAQAWFAGQDSVERIEPNLIRTLDQVPNDPSFGQLWGMNNTGQSSGLIDADIDAPEAWDLSTGSKSVVVAIIDTGIDYNHPDLAANMWRNSGEIPGNGVDDDGNGFVDDYYGWDFVNGDSDPLDDHGHGTHTAGTVGAVGNNGVGLTGVNWNVSLMALKILAANGSGPISAGVSAINYVSMMKLRGINLVASNNSYGASGYVASEYNAIAGNAAAGVLFAASAGNSSYNNDGSLASYPASYKLDNILSVASTNRNDVRSSFSNYGPNSVHLAAPGESIWSTYKGGTYASLSGTSMAGPHVAGVIALAAAYRPQATPAQIRTAILSSVDPLAGLSGVVITGGRLNARKALEALANATASAKLSIADASIAEGNSGTKLLTFTVSLDAASTQPVSVDWSTAANTAKAGTDFTAASGTLTFPAGTLTRSLTVSIVGDTLYEGNETFFVNLANATGASIDRGQGVGTILDDDPLPKLVLAGGSITEGHAGIKLFALKVTLSPVSGVETRVNYATVSDTTGAYPATSGEDFNLTTGTLVIPAGTTSATFNVEIIGDRKNEQKETFLAVLSSPVNATINSGTAVVSILDDDPIPNIRATDLALTEGSSGTRQAKVTVKLSSVLDVPTSFDYSTAVDSTGANPATPGVDFVPTSGTLVVPLGSAVGYIYVDINPDTKHEPNETFLVVLSNAQNGVIMESTAVVTIIDDDPLPTIKIASASTTEGGSGTKLLRFTVTLSNALDVDTSVNYATQSALVGALATAGVDYVPTSGTLVFPAGTKTGYIYVAVNGDYSIEPDEVFNVALSSPVNGVIGLGVATGTILNDDKVPTISIADASIVEGNAGTKVMRFTVKLSNAIDYAVSLDFATADATSGALALAGEDYVATSGTLLIPAGTLVGYVSVTVKGDFKVESDEIFLLNLSNALGATFANTTAVGKILNDDV